MSQTLDQKAREAAQSAYYFGQSLNEDQEAQVDRCLTAYLAALPPPEGDAQCCMCGKTGLSTVEDDGGTECQLADGRWTCSADCYYRATDPTPEGDVEELVARMRRLRHECAASGLHDHDGCSCSDRELLERARPPAPTGEVVAWTSDYVLGMLKEGREVNALLVPASDKAHGIALYASPVVASAKAGEPDIVKRYRDAVVLLERAQPGSETQHALGVHQEARAALVLAMNQSPMGEGTVWDRKRFADALIAISLIRVSPGEALDPFVLFDRLTVAVNVARRALLPVEGLALTPADPLRSEAAPRKDAGTALPPLDPGPPSLQGNGK